MGGYYENTMEELSTSYEHREKMRKLELTRFGRLWKFIWYGSN